MNRPPANPGIAPMVFLILSSIIIIAENVLLLVLPQSPGSLQVLAIIGIAAGFVSLVSALAALIARLRKKARIVEMPPPAVVAAPPPPPAGAAGNEQAVMLLSLLQEKGRFVDFVMEDIVSYSNEQVGAAARVVHQGCREVILESFNPRPITDAKESSRVVLEKGFNADEYRLVGKVSGTPPYSGVLVHKGWKARQVKLPRVNNPAEDPDTPVILPAEVEL
jgi:hypothetical protein